MKQGESPTNKEEKTKGRTTGNKNISQKIRMGDIDARLVKVSESRNKVVGGVVGKKGVIISAFDKINKEKMSEEKEWDDTARNPAVGSKILEVLRIPNNCLSYYESICRMKMMQKQKNVALSLNS